MAVRWITDCILITVVGKFCGGFLVETLGRRQGISNQILGGQINKKIIDLPGGHSVRCMHAVV